MIALRTLPEVDEKKASRQPSPMLALALSRALAVDWDRLVLVPMVSEGLELFAPELERLSSSRAFEGVKLIDARGLPADARPELLAKLSPASRWVVLVDPPEENVLATLLCGDADALLLLVRKGETRMQEVRAAVERCGPEKFIGSLLLAGE